VHENLWAGIDFKRANAEFFLEEMARVLQPDRSHMAAVLQSHGGWQQTSLYAYVDAFLVMTRSIPAIIEYGFGKDPIFDKGLSEQRNRSFHRKGYPAVQVKIAGLYGIDYVGDPL
jgi:hypothetical protein